jgi:hypothetical protein
MYTLGITPSRFSYSVTSQDGISVNHDGPRSRIRRGVANTRRVQASWNVNEIGYQYLRAFFRSAIKEGSEPFIAKIQFEDDTVTLHKAQIVPGTFNTTAVNGSSFTVEAEMNVERKKL